MCDSRRPLNGADSEPLQGWPPIDPERLLNALDEDVAEYVDGPETAERALETRDKSLNRIGAALAAERALGRAEGSRATVEKVRVALEADLDIKVTGTFWRRMAE